MEQKRAQGKGRRNKRPLCWAGSWEAAAARTGEHFQGLPRGRCLESPQGSPDDTTRAGFTPKSVLCPATHTPKEKPATAQAVSRVASSRVTRQAKPSRTLQEPDFTAETQRAPFQPELLTLSTKQRVMQKDPWGQGSIGREPDGFFSQLTWTMIRSWIIPRRPTHGGFCDRREPAGKRETPKRPWSATASPHSIPFSVQAHQGL